MIKEYRFGVVLLALVLLVGAVPATFAQTTNTWANSNVSNTPNTFDWFTGGPNTQGTWTGGTPVSSSLNTIQFFESTTAFLPHTVTTTIGSIINHGGTAFELGTLILSGKYSSQPNMDLTVNISGDALNFSGVNGTVEFNTVSGTAYSQDVTFNVGNAIRLGTASSASVLTLTGNGGGLQSFNFNGNITELQIGGGSKLVKSGSSIAAIFGNVTVSGGVEVSAGTLNLTGGGNAITGGIVFTGGTLGSGISTITLNNNQITVNGSSTLQLASGATTSGGVTLNSGILSAGSNTGGVTFNGAMTGSGGFRLIQLGMGGSTANLNSSANSFTGPLEVNCAGYSGTVNFKSLGDSAGAGNIRFLASDAISKIFNFTGDAPLTLNYRKIEIANTGSDYQIRNQSTQAFTINTDLSVTANGSRTIQFGGTGAGLSTFAGKIGNGTADSMGVTKIESGTWILAGTNTYSGTTTVLGGKLILSNLWSVATGSLAITSGKVRLDYGGTRYVAGLAFGATNQMPGVYNSSNSPAYIEGIGNLITGLPILSVTYNDAESTGGSAPVDWNAYTNGQTVSVLGSGTLYKVKSDVRGWTTQPAGGGIRYTQGSVFVITNNTELYPRWTGEGTVIIIR